MIVPEEQKISFFDPHAGISSPPPSYVELVNQAGGARQTMPNPHAAMHSASLPLPPIPHETHHHYGRHPTMPEPTRFMAQPSPSPGMAPHLENVHYLEVQKDRIEEQRRNSQFEYQRRSFAPSPLMNRASQYKENTDVSSIPTQNTGTSMDKSFDALNPNPPMPPPRVSTQPSLQKSMDVRNVRQKPVLTNGDRDWSHGCCNSMCEGCGACCCACWCPCVSYSKIKSRLSFLERNNYPHPSGGDGCTSDCFIHGCLTSLCGIGWVMQIGLRSSIRDRYRITGTGCGDFCCSFCCTPCSLAQESLEVQLEEQALMGSGKWGMPLQGGS